MPFANRNVAVVGVYTTEQARRMERTSFSLQLEALKGAVDDAGLTLADVDGLAPMIGTDHHNDQPLGSAVQAHQFWSEQLGGRAFRLTIPGGAAAQLSKSAGAIAAGLADVVVMFYGKSGVRTGPSGTGVQDKAPRVQEWSFAQSGTYMTTWYALWAQRYMHEFGTTHADLAEVAVLARRHATLNPNSVMGSRGEITVQDVLESRPICSPLNLLDCSIDNDGGYAVVLAAESVARNCRHKPVWVIGAGEGYFTDFYATVNEPWFPEEGRGVRTATDTAFGMAGVSRADIDVAGLYDCFTITLLRDLEEMGFCKLGEGADYVKEGHLRLGGKMPTNTDGGLLSNSHAGDPAGMMTIEVARQLRGQCGQRQVSGAKIGVSMHQGYSVHGVAGVMVMATD
jgi:acetyl-CoA C-acetyltransferase